MEKMISVINNNLISVINGIKEHKASAEELLATIKNEMDRKVDIAQEYKNNVEDAKNKIARLEAEIKDLEKDLEDLNHKFDGKDFREILNAGNKEINSKIIEKRKAISVQGKRILDITDKAHDLKEELVDLKNRRTAAEEDLVKTNIVINYYEPNINNMIDFTTYHIDELQGFSVPEYDEEEIEKIDINKIADGKIFEEIVDISNSEPDADLVEKALNNKQAFDEEFAELISEDSIVSSDSMTETLDSIISTGKDIVSSGKYVGMIDFNDKNLTGPITVASEEQEETGALGETEFDDFEETTEEPKEEVEEVKEDSTEDVNSETTEEVKEDSNIEDEEMMIVFDDDKESQQEESSNEEETTKENVENNEEINFDDFIISFDDVAEELNLNESTTEENTESVQEEPEEVIVTEDSLSDTTTFDSTIFETEEPVEETTDEENVDKYFDNEVSIPGFDDKYEDTAPEATPISEDLGSTKKEVIKNLLLKTGASEEDIDKYVTDVKDIDTDRLKREVENDKEREIADILVGVMPLKEDVIQDVLDLDNEQNKVLKKAAGRRYITINAFPDIVKTNFETIKNLGVKDPIGILINHPTRFTMNPTNFNDILDKYDEEDLVRCLDKNGAVIDKL